MFEPLIERVQENICIIQATIQTNERLRRIAFEETPEILTIREYFQTQELTKQIIQEIRNEKKWREYERCAVVTRLYAVYESFVEDLVANWLEILPKIVPRYTDLDERIRNTHREGVGRLLIELKKTRFSGLTDRTVVESLLSGIGGNPKYNLVPQAFLFHEQNLRKDILEKLLADAGIPNAWKWIEKHRHIQQFAEKKQPEYRRTAEAELNQLISDRNDAAHATMDQTLSTSELLDLADFILALCQALAELVTYQIILKQASTGKAREIGKINRWFDKARAARAKINQGSLSVGDRVFLLNENSSDCRLAVIKSIQLDDVSQSQIEITSETEVGLQFNIDAKKGLILYVSDYF